MPTPLLRGHVPGMGDSMPSERRAGHATLDEQGLPQNIGTHRPKRRPHSPRPDKPAVHPCRGTPKTYGCRQPVAPGEVTPPTGGGAPRGPPARGQIFRIILDIPPRVGDKLTLGSGRAFPVQPSAGVRLARGDAGARTTEAALAPDILKKRGSRKAVFPKRQRLPTPRSLPRFFCARKKQRQPAVFNRAVPSCRCRRNPHSTPVPSCRFPVPAVAFTSSAARRQGGSQARTSRSHAAAECLRRRRR